MTNFEKHFDDLYSVNFAVVNGDISVCETTPCSVCKFSERNTGTDCYIGRMEWLKAEYEEPKKINIPDDTPIDSKVLVSTNGTKWIKRYYAGKRNGKHVVWQYGATSWTCEPDEISQWEYMKLYE